MAPRPICSGTISFGLVGIPVRMLTATSSHELRFHFADRRDPAPLGYDRVRKDTGEHPEDLERAQSLVESLGSRFDPGRYDDTYRAELLELICAKAEGEPLCPGRASRRARPST